MTAAATLEVLHDTRYAYAATVSPAMHLAHLQPLTDGAQALVDHELTIDPGPDEIATEPDVFGNARCRFAVVAPHRQLHVRAFSRVRVAPRFAELDLATSPAWEHLVERLHYVARAPFEPAVEFVQPSPYVPRLAALRDYARPSFGPGRPAAEAVVELMHRVHADFAYDGSATHIDTPLADVLADRRGVCQDFAHLMAGALRMTGLPARYVSGYLLTHAPEGGAALVGADASHAWVQVWVPGTAGVADDGWLDLDPTNDLVPGTGHVRLAVGRDYGDVTPLRGVILGGGAHTLEVAVRTRLLGPGVA
jgi:transglutaminase-like putative cysteine protease